jgi:hypothetical protein
MVGVVVVRRCAGAHNMGRESWGRKDTNTIYNYLQENAYQ